MLKLPSGIMKSEPHCNRVTTDNFMGGKEDQGDIGLLQTSSSHAHIEEVSQITIFAYVF